MYTSSRVAYLPQSGDRCIIIPPLIFNALEIAIRERPAADRFVRRR